MPSLPDLSFPLMSRRSIPLILALGMSAMALAADAPPDDPKPAWRNGPVRSILTGEEDKAFKSAKTDEERAKAISEFWARRDPNPATPINEYKDSFYKRVEEATKEFKESTGPGWSTDRGRVLLVLGYPAERKPGPGDSQETWIYSALAANSDAIFSALDGLGAASGKTKDAKSVESRAELKQELASASKVVFAKSEGGDYSLSEGERLLNAVRKLEPREAAIVSMPRELALASLKAAPSPKAAAAGTTPPEAAKAPPAEAKGPPAPPPAKLAPGVDRLKEAALAAEPKNEIGLETSVRYFKSEDGSTRTVVMIAVKKSEIAMNADGKPRTVLYARFMPVGGAETGAVEFLEPELFTSQDDAAEGWLKYAFAWSLKQKKYELRVAASDGPDGKIGTRIQAVELPDFKNETLALSSVTLARSSSPTAAEGEDNFRIGAMRMIPWVKPALSVKDELSFFYDVYNAKKDPGTNKPSLDVAYIFEKKEASGWKRRGRLAEVDKHEETLGYIIPAEAISQWPAGDYKLTIQVKDKIQNAETSSSVEFSIVR